jgi:ABC-type multidrug transport system ATPase subunit
MASAALQLTSVTKRYRKRVALDGLSFSVPRGSVTGLIGPNGAGKTTCFGVIGGLLRADAGQIDVLGQGPFEPSRQRGLLGLLPQDSELAGHGRVGAQLTYLARLQGLSAHEAARDAERVLELVSLSDRKGARIVELSHGMRRRVSVAQALLGVPQLVLLDEPTSGLDPHLVKHMRDVIVEENRRRGTTFVVSSHVLADLEAICDHVVFVEDGRAIGSGSIAQITGRGQSVRIRVTDMPSMPALARVLEALEIDVQGDVLVVRVPQGSDVARTNARVLPALIALDAGVLEVRAGDSLERTYLAQREASRREG